MPDESVCSADVHVTYTDAYITTHALKQDSLSLSRPPLSFFPLYLVTFFSSFDKLICVKSRHARPNRISSPRPQTTDGMKKEIFKFICRGRHSLTSIA